jgi:RNA polymerase sigma-70 factor, ECF subfamily
MTVDRERLEEDVRSRCREGDVAGGAALAIRGYGPEVLGFLSILHPREADADEVFSIWSERLFRGLPAFAWGCSLRTWAYTIARNASRNFRRDERVRRAEPLPESASIHAIEQQVRTETKPYLRTEVKDKFAELRDALPPEDRALLVLRLDKRLEWKDVARVMLGDEGADDAAALTREAQRLRKRFQLVKGQLVEAARSAGLLGDKE